MAEFIIGGLRFSRWTTLFPEPTPRTVKRWFCQCECGRIKLVTIRDFTHGRSRSCGRHEKPRLNLPHRSPAKRKLPTREQRRTYRHGCPEYFAWRDMIRRCHNPNNKNYARYGGRGITVCDRWRLSYDAFLADMGNRPDDSLSLDRINNNGNYEPSNCRWATRSQQMANRSVSRPASSKQPKPQRTVICNGIARTLPEWAKISGIPLERIRSRLCRGWAPEEAVTVLPLPRGVFLHPCPSQARTEQPPLPK